jgi:putative spermidine/putrescine transport system permease protein
MSPAPTTSRWGEAGLWAALLLASPVLLGLVYAAFASVGVVGPGSRGWSLEGWNRLSADSGVWRGILWSLWIAGASTFLATLGAILLAVTFQGSGRVDRSARLLALLPLPLPHLVAGVGGVLVLGQSGILSRIAAGLGWISTPAEMPALVADSWGVGLILMLVWKEITFLALVAFSVLATQGRTIEEAGRTLGAGPGATFRRLTLPLLWRGMLPAVVAVFTFVAGSWEAAALLAPSDPLALPLQIMERHTDPALARRGEAYALALVALLIAALAVAVHERVRLRWKALES